MALEHPPERRVEPPRAIALGRAHELVLEPEAVQERLQTRGSCYGRNSLRSRTDRESRSAACGDAPRPSRAAGCCRARRAARPCRRRTRRACRPARQPLERLADQGRAKHLGEGADVRQARRPVAGLEQHEPLRGRRPARSARSASRPRPPATPCSPAAAPDPPPWSSFSARLAARQPPRRADPARLPAQGGDRGGGVWPWRAQTSARRLGSGSSPGRMPSSAAKIPRVTNRLS